MTIHQSRRSFLGNTFSAALTSALIQAQPFVKSRGWVDTAHAGPDVTHDTFNGLFAFVLPGSDAYSIAQGVSTVDQGGVDTGAIDVFIRTVDASTPFIPSFSAQVAAILNSLATSVNPGGGGSMISPFANLTFAQKT